MNLEHELSLVSETVRQLSKAIATGFLYSPEHAQVRTSLALLLDQLHALFRNTPELTLIVSGEDVLYQGKPLEKSPQTERLARTCALQNVGFITFHSGTDAADLRQLIRGLVGDAALETLKNDLATIVVGGIETPEEIEAVEAVVPIESFDQLTSSQLEGLETLYGQIGDREQFDLQGITSLVAGFIAAFKKAASPLMALVPIRSIDDYSFTHSINVGILNIAQGMSLGVDGPLLHDLGVGGMLHDAGKIFVDKEIIQKPGELTEEEWEVIKTHPSRGAQYLMGQKGIPPVAIICAYEHHMRYDCAGYPSVPEDWPLHLCSQMTMISDTFDALRTQRAYKDAWDFPKTSGLMLKLAGKNLNPDLTLNFLKLLSELSEELPAHQMDEGSRPLKKNYCE